MQALAGERAVGDDTHAFRSVGDLPGFGAGSMLMLAVEEEGDSVPSPYMALVDGFEQQRIGFDRHGTDISEDKTVEARRNPRDVNPGAGP
jgi:hypothetical protein